MRTLLMIATGVVLALAFDRVGAALVKRRGGRGAEGTGLFIWIWLVVASVDFWIGVEAGNGVGLELGVHLLIFIVPAALAWYLSRRYRARAEPH
jgi:hypothetical protein